MTTPTAYMNISGQMIQFSGTEFVHDPYITQKFKAARTWTGTAVDINMPKARNIHRDRLRAERAPRLEALDAAWFRAAETGDAAKQAEVAAAKQRLRDVVEDARIDAAATPEELLGLTLDVLTS